MKKPFTIPLICLGKTSCRCLLRVQAPVIRFQQFKEDGLTGLKGAMRETMRYFATACSMLSDASRLVFVELENVEIGCLIGKGYSLS